MPPWLYPRDAPLLRTKGPGAWNWRLATRGEPASMGVSHHAQWPRPVRAASTRVTPMRDSLSGVVNAPAVRARFAGDGAASSRSLKTLLLILKETLLQSTGKGLIYLTPVELLARLASTGKIFMHLLCYVALGSILHVVGPTAVP